MRDYCPYNNNTVCVIDLTVSTFTSILDDYSPVQITASSKQLTSDCDSL